MILPKLLFYYGEKLNHDIWGDQCPWQYWMNIGNMVSMPDWLQSAFMGVL